MGSELATPEVFINSLVGLFFSIMINHDLLYLCQDLFGHHIESFIELTNTSSTAGINSRCVFWNNWVSPGIETVC